MTRFFGAVGALALASCGSSGTDDATRASDCPAVEPDVHDLVGHGEQLPIDVVPTDDAASIVSHTLPAALECGQSASVEVVVRNDGTATWTNDWRLGAVDDADPLGGAGRALLPEGTSVAPGETHAFAFTLTAPQDAGTYTSDWRMVHELVRWFGAVASQDVVVTCPERVTRTGSVSLNGRSLHDDGGDFHALGATMFYALWAYEFDRERLERNLAFLSAHDFDFVRVLGVVGDANDPNDYWHDRAADWRWADYDAAIAGLTDLAYDTYGIRIEWTIFGGSPDDGDRIALADRFLAMANARPQKVLMFEVANESWQNGFEGADGLAALRDISEHMKDNTDVLVAASAPSGGCAEFAATYADEIADIATVHFDRTNNDEDGGWRPVWQPWHAYDCSLGMVVSNNEPIGPGSSVATENDPAHLAAAVLVSGIAGLPIHVFHSRAGVRGDFDFAEMAGADTVHIAKSLLPTDVASWQPVSHEQGEHPFVIYRGRADGQLRANELWPQDVEGDASDDSVSGVVGAYAAVRGDRFVMAAFGVLGSVEMDARRACTFTVYDVVTGAALSTRTVAAGERVHLEGAGAFFLDGVAL